MHGIGNNMFQGIEQNDDSLYSSKENDESDGESGKSIPLEKNLSNVNSFYVSTFLIIQIRSINAN